MTWSLSIGEGAVLGFKSPKQINQSRSNHAYFVSVRANNKVNSQSNKLVLLKKGK